MVRPSPLTNPGCVDLVFTTAICVKSSSFLKVFERFGRLKSEVVFGLAEVKSIEDYVISAMLHQVD